uniref:Uncharacterized protein n=1 Tax=Caenorhabditis japonica TaxID=281687 RepID=A0A8R1DFE1_CAEJA
MIALQNVQGIYIRGSYNYPARGDAISIQEISLDVAVPESTLVAGLPSTKAIGVEKCNGCPQGYSGLSCQNPVEGYCRKKHRDYLNQADDLALIGWSEPCSCHGHSQTCHPDTCVCTDCEHSTFGDSCEHCLSGYIGDAREGGTNSCTKCACPLIENSFSDSCVAVDYGRGYVCNACKPGYTGQYCETCVAGYYGDPEHVGGFCAPCDCHPDGSLHGACNPLSGQCECKPGVTGRDCSRCQERHAFINRVCTSCDQGCYLPLMLEIDDMESHLGQQNFTNLKPIPWKRVWRINNETTDLDTFLKGIDKDGEFLADSKYTKDAMALLDEVDFQVGRVNKSGVSIKQFTSLVENLILDVQISYANAFNTTNFLKMFAEHGETTVGGEVLNKMLKDSETQFNETTKRGEYIEKRHYRSEQEHLKAEQLLKEVTAKKLNETIFEDLKNRIDVLEQWTNDFKETIYDVAKKSTVDAEKMSTVVEKRINRYKEVSNEIEKLRVETEDQIAFSRNAIEKARSEDLMNMVEDKENINMTLMALPELMEQCSNITLLYSQLIDEYDEEYVQASSQHATELERQAQQIVDRFADTRTETENPLRASNAFDNIVEALKNATEAVNSAAEVSEDVDKVMGSAAEEDKVESLTIQLSRLRNMNETVDTKEDEELVKELKKKRQQLTERIAQLNERKTEIAQRLGVIKNEAFSWDDKHDRMHSILKNGAKTAHESATHVKKITEAVKTEIVAIKAEVEILLNSTSGGIQEEMQKIRQVRTKMENGAQQLSKIEKLSTMNHGRGDKMSKNIALLKDKIEQARENAHQIRLALYSGERGVCKRSFISPSTSSPTNNIHILYRPLQKVANALIMVTKTKGKRTQASEYIAVEVKDQRVVVHWDIGSGKKMVTNSHAINYVPSNDRATWYHIDIFRFANTVNLTVALKESFDGSFRPKGVPVSAFVGGDSEDSMIFNVAAGETTIDVGTDESTATEIGLVTNKFFGIVGKLRVDDTTLPLWTFQSTTNECEGANSPPKFAQRGHLFRDGFANVSMHVSERTMSAITVTFNSYSPNGLLYFRGSEASGDFVSIFMSDGHVVFKIKLGQGSVAQLTSLNVYNDGKEHTVKAIRTGSEMFLQVDSDADRFNLVIPGEHTALNIDNDQHYVAGVPAALNREIFGDDSIQWSGFIGCILTVKPSQLGELDLEHPDQSKGKEEGCQFNGASERVVGFPKPGFLVTKGVVIDNSSSFSFSFRTKEENGTLVYQSSQLNNEAAKDGKGYMAFYLFRGYLVLHFGKDASSRKNVVTFRSSHPYNDGQVHVVFMTRHGKTLQVKVDDKEIGVSQTLEDESHIGSSHRPLIFGGFSDDLKPQNNELPITSPFIGCISHVYLNLKQVPLTPVKHNALIGMCSMDQTQAHMIDDPIDGEGHNGHRKYSKLSLDQATHRNFYEITTLSSRGEHSRNLSDACDAFGGSIKNSEGAVRFGTTKASHSRINFDSPYPNITDFTVSLSIRTESPDGMIWVWSNYKNYTRYIFLNVIDGFATVEVKGHRQPKYLKHSERRINDGGWHDVVVEKRNKLLTLKIDELEAVEMTDCPTPKVMKKRVYIGGVISRHRRQFGLTTPGLDGCLRNFKMNNVAHVLDDPKSSRNVYPCTEKCGKFRARRRKERRQIVE